VEYGYSYDRGVGRLFRTFDEAWRHFLARREPLEVLEPPFGSGSTLVWLVPVDGALVPRLRDVQAPLARLPFLRLMPEHFLHVTVALLGPVDTSPPVDECVRAGERAWGEVPAFEVAVGRVNCFHEAVVVEVSAERWDLPQRLAGGPLDFVLPHVTLAGAVGGDPEALRAVVVPLRDVEIGVQRVTHVDLCLVPTAPETFLQPWEVVGRVPLRG
jgi:2'-5' RNA ligase